MKIKLLFYFFITFSNSYLFSQYTSSVILNPLPTFKNLKFISNFENTIYICGDEGSIFKSSNYGLNWINISLPFQTTVENVRFFNKDTGYASGNGASFIAYSTNGGLNWICSPGQAFSDIEFVKRNVGYAIINNVSPRKTTNAGINWQLDSNILYQGSSSKYFTSIKFFNEFTGYISEVSNTNNSTKILKTTNGGLNWNLNTTINSRIYSINLLNIDTVVVFGKIGTEKHVAYTTNQGMNWITHTLIGITADPIVCWDGAVGILSSAGDGKLYLSNNLGQFWYQLSEEYITDAIKIEQNFFAVGNYGRMYKSNNGNNWTNIQYSSSVGWPFYDKYNSNNIYYEKSDGIYKLDTSTNTLIFDNRTIGTRVYYQYSPNKMVRIIGYYKSVSTNNGQTWSSGAYQIINPEIIGLYYYSEHYGIAVSRWGTIWKDFSGGYGTFTLQHTPADTLNSFIAIPEKNKLLVFSENGKKIFYSDSLGDNWQSQNISINTRLRFVRNIDTLLVAVDIQNRIHLSSNYGQSWTQIYTCSSNESIQDLRLKSGKIFHLLKRINDISFNSTTKLITSTNGGQNWIDNFTTNYNYSYIDLFNNGYIILYGGSSWMSLFKNGGYFTPFNFSAYFFPESFIGNFRISSFSELNDIDIKRTQLSSDRNFNNILFDTSFIGTQLNIFNSCALEYNSKRYTRVKIKRGGIETDWKVDSIQVPGKSNSGQWFSIRIGDIIKQKNNKIIFTDSLNGIILSDSGRIFKTNKSGICWEKYQFNSNSNLNDFLKYDLTTSFICGDSGKIYKSTNLGVSWQSINFLNPIKLISLNKNDSNIFLISKSGHIYKSTNIGLNWELLYNDSVITLNSSAILNNKIYVCGNNGLIIRSDNNGSNWQNISLTNNINLNKIQIFNEKIYISADSGKIFVSDNAGENFTLIQTPITGSINEIFSTQNSIFASCNNSTILKSTNSGLSWSISTKQINGEFNNLNSLSIINNKELWTVGERNTVVYIPSITNLSEIKTYQHTIVNNFELHQNFPNPFNPNTTIQFDLPYQSKISLKIINILGQEISVLVNNETLDMGRYNYNFNGSSLPSGVYFYILESEKFRNVKKMVLIK